MFIHEEKTQYVLMNERKPWFKKPLVFVVVVLMAACFFPVSQCSFDARTKVARHVAEPAGFPLAPGAPAAAPVPATPSVPSASGLTLANAKLQPGWGAEAKDAGLKEKIAAAFESPFYRNEFPAEIQVAGLGKALVKYSIDPVMQNEVQKLIASYEPDYAAFVAMDAVTGKVLSLVSYTRRPSTLGNLALKTMFPSASVFKIVTATAAIDREHVTPDTQIAFTGANHTLYRRNVMDQSPHRWARRITLREAFAKSINTVFAKLGVFFLKPFELEEYARRFGFNQAVAADLPLQTGRFQIPDTDPFVVAEMASGYNRLTLISPVQGAMIAASIANDGVMMEPHVVDSLISPDGKLIYAAEPERISVTMAKESAEEVRALMRETVRRGTSRKSFVTLLHKRFAESLDVGGKTGSLMSLSPRGKCDWFVGYGRRDGKRIAVAALTVNESNWKVKSSFLAREYIERYFNAPGERLVAAVATHRRHRHRHHQ